MTALTLDFAQISAGDVALVGGKGANLGALTRAGFQVPPGFCVTAAAFEQFLAALPDADARFAALDAVAGDDAQGARVAAESMRAALEQLPVPPALSEAIVRAWRTLGVDFALAVRSSATAEDLPDASFAGQQDTYLNVRGERALLDAVRRCWASLFTDRAVLYRARAGYGHRAVHLAVVVQRLVDPEVSGILFTADPVSGHRGVLSIDAGFGLGEALVSGLINADLYRVDRASRAVLEARAGDKSLAIRSVPGGGTVQEQLPPSQRKARVLDDAQVLALASLGERVEAHYGGVPQDVEWCLAGGAFYLVQARPITSLFPVPETAHAGDEGLRVFLSFGHMQMMTDAMPRLAREVWKLLIPAGKGHAPTLDEPAVLSPVMVEAASRLFVDVTVALRVPRARKMMLATLGHIYEELARSARELASRPAFARGRPEPLAVLRSAASILGPVWRPLPSVFLFGSPAKRAAETARGLSNFVDAAEKRIASRITPAARVAQGAREINSAFSGISRYLAPLPSGIIAHRLLVRAAEAPWAEGVRDEVDRLLRGLPGNVTTEMDLRVGDLADLVRPHPRLAERLRTEAWSALEGQLGGEPGGAAFDAAFKQFIAQYGARGASEIDLSRPRWRDDPALLFRVLEGGLAASREAGTHRRQHDEQRAQGEAAQERLIEAAGAGLAGPVRRWWVGRLCKVSRAGLGLREHPKFTIVRLLGVVREEVRAAAKILVERGQLADAAQVWHLGFDELVRALAEPELVLGAELATRAERFERDRSRKPPLVLSSEGETPTLAYDRTDMPEGALAGTAASKGVVEGVARVVRDPQTEVLEAGEILVAPFTDPGWTPLFVHAAALVTEVGGLMTHGAVVAREYGIPAVVSVAGATERIRSGQRLRVDGTRGFVLVLGEP